MTWIVVLVLAVIILLFLPWSKEKAVKEKIVLLDKKKFRERKVRDFLKKHGKITNEQYRKLVGVSQSQATRDLDELEKKGLIKQVGKSGPTVKYRLKK